PPHTTPLSLHDALPIYDYVVKPFSGPELVARIHSVLRRSQRQPVAGERLEFDALTIDLQTREVTVDGQVVDTTAKEFDLLVFLRSEEHTSELQSQSNLV